MTTPAQIPEQHIDMATIGHMTPGDSGYTVPWAMRVDPLGGCWLHTGYSLNRQPGGTVRMHVRRTTHGWDVTLPVGETWRPEPLPDCGDRLQPITTIHTAYPRQEPRHA